MPTGARWVFGLALAATLSGDAFPDTSAAGTVRLDELTRAFAGFDVRDMSGRRWTAAGLRGRVVVLDFWATWCPPCWREIPWLQQIHERFDPARVQVIGVTMDVTDRRTLVSWLNRRRIDWPQVWESHGYESLLAKRFGVGSLPTTFVVAADGRVVAAHLRGAALVEVVEALLADGGSAGVVRRPATRE